MKFLPTKVSGAMIVEVDEQVDNRGTFARAFCAETFSAYGLATDYPQWSHSFNHRRGTLRGMHYQADPQSEAKLVRATRGRVFDVVLDLRPKSKTFLGWASVELDARSRNALYIPEGCAHGFMTLEDDCELLYQISKPYAPNLARGIRWDDPQFGIRWPFAPTVMSERDAAFENYSQGSVI